ncbi:very short patch repair endonuclease [Ancylobacter sp. FA202]|uniref:very short patch repair endonuclease n=1 Tax=Ancylobacter sp. FA202 TaxID=1111106 RepID=UPI000368858A|nr:very short patch repair endonuclease [Ancylobacter sp. FA202]
MDKLDLSRRSANMRAIRSKDTKPELMVRRALRALGFTGYRLHRKDLPGKPDIAFIGKTKAIFVHGCFWHGHDCREGARTTRSNQHYWIPKISGNRERDARHARDLVERGWKVLIIWECEVGKDDLTRRLKAFICD